MRQLSFTPLQPHAVTCVCFTGKEEMITGSSDGSLCVWRAGKVSHSVAAHGGGVSAVSGCGGGEGFWSCGADGSLTRWSVDAASEVVLVMRQSHSISSFLQGALCLPPAQFAATSLSVRPGYSGQVALGLPFGSVVVFEAGSDGSRGRMSRVTEGAGGGVVKAVVGLNRTPHLFLTASGDCTPNMIFWK
jgi:WD40 repeat protein